jgi:hypothetical protein
MGGVAKRCAFSRAQPGGENLAVYFFKPSRHAADEITGLFSFVWPTAAALWNLRWQVAGYLDAVPTASVEELNDRFVTGSKLIGADLRGACVDTDWDEQRARFASIILTSAFAIYESWADEIIADLGLHFSGKRFQFPDSQATSGNGLESFIASLTATPSITLNAAYFPLYARSAKYNPAILPNLLLAYRYFKEVRNSEMHRGGIANAKAEAAYLAFKPVSDRVSLGMKGELMIEPVISERPVRLHLRGVVGFSDILFRIIATVDAELCRTIRAELPFRRDLAAVKNEPAMYSGTERRRHQQTGSRCVKAGYPRPLDPASIYAFLRSENLIRI